MGGKDRIPAFLVICLVFILSHYTASTSWFCINTTCF
jgi:hypothetical protein